MVLMKYLSLSTIMSLNSRDRHEKHGVPLFRASTTRLTIHLTPLSTTVLLYI